MNYFILYQHFLIAFKWASFKKIWLHTDEHCTEFSNLKLKYLLENESFSKIILACYQVGSIHEKIAKNSCDTATRILTLGSVSKCGDKF